MRQSPWKLTVPCTEPSSVYDCHTGALLGSVAPGQAGLAVPLGADRARLLYVGPDTEWRKRTAAAKEETPR